MSVYRKFAGQTAIYGISTIAARLLNFLLTPLYTRVYQEEVYGIFTEMYAWAALINALLAFGMETTYFRYLQKHDDKQAVYSNGFLLVGALSALFLAGSFANAQGLAALMQKDLLVPAGEYTDYIRLFAWIVFFDNLAVLPFARLRAEGRAVRYSLLKFLNIAVFILLNLLLIVVVPYAIREKWAFHDTLQQLYGADWIGYVFIANLAASALTFLLLTPELLKVRFRVNLELMKKMLAYSWPILIANISFIINENISRILMGFLLPAQQGMRDLGIFGACSKLAIFLNIFVQAFRLGAEPFFFSHSAAAGARQTYAVIMRYFVIASATCFLAIITNISLLKYFIGSEYWEGLNVVPILLLGYLCLGVYMNLSIWYKLSDQTRFGFYISGLGALSTILLNIWLIPRYSYIGSAWATLGAYGFMMVLSYVLGQRNYPIPYELKKNLQYIGISIILAFLSFTVMDSNIWAGNLLLLLYVGFIYAKEQKNIKRMLNRK
ncbi:O-antigen/teichoic acid export membrane protein [Anseongella ginsenosidimutans]|uniref:O-antigen/teichoic acid export membrane protein n=1 Tax=Anseongella ginsenosidimutans TaxID=496056 RepID=A0A4R3KY12_9SPHI|nr:polysaccharide biosynthesis C-terminal domain-containing protein [Anseongella ginsenosidimutans]QEC51033.1 oligosaccharide flippase family protein [Anseongella ginsenosidimutans]TCS90311.1 O-antigen/teichoic acid export membrane protein [Anseongella ginsenosidimutans]